MATSSRLGHPRERVGRFLAAFAQRTKLHRSVRGLCLLLGFTAVWVSCMMLVDIVMVVDDRLRWCLACVGYVIALGVGWLSGLFAFWNRPSPENLASQIGVLQPSLGDSLLSSIELRSEDGTIRNGSHAFVRKLEQDVATELSYLDMHELVPWRLPHRAIAVVCALILIWSVFSGLNPQWAVPQRLARALIPFAVIDRPSNVLLRVLEPTTDPLVVPSEQSIRFAVEVRRGHCEQAWLEIQDLDRVTQLPCGETRRIGMLIESDEPQRFGITASVSDHSLRFRMVAGDAKTAYRTIRTVVRPKANQFRVHVEPPEYAGLAPVQLIHESGNMQILQGSQVRLEVETNSKLRKGSMAIEKESQAAKELMDLELRDKNTLTHLTGDEPQSPALESSTTLASAHFRVDQSLRYQLKLQSELEYRGVPIENSFSPIYRIQSHSDQAPQIQWMITPNTLWTSNPSEEAWVVAPNESIGMAAYVQDEMPVDQLFLEFNQNGGEWRRSSARTDWSWDRQNEEPSDALTALSTYGAKSHWSFDLSECQAQSGDALHLRLSAIDRFGNHANSPEIRLQLSQVGLDRNRHQRLNDQAQLVRSIHALEQKVMGLRSGLAPWAGAQPTAPSFDSQQMRNTLARTAKDFAQLRESTHTLLSEGQKLLADKQTILDQGDLELVLWAIIQIDHQRFGQLEDQVANTTNSAQSSAAELDALLRSLHQTTEQAEMEVKQLQGCYRKVFGLNFQTAITEELTHFSNHLRSTLYRSPLPDIDALKRACQASDWYLASTMKLADNMQSSLPESVRSKLSGLYEWIDRNRSDFRNQLEAVESPQANEQLRTRMERCLHDLRQARWGFQYGENMIARGPEARRELRKAIGLIAETNILEAAASLVPPFANSVDSPATRALLQLGSAWMERRSIHQLRSNADSLFANDLGNAYRAWTWVAGRAQVDRSVGTSLDGALREIAAAARILEAYHEAVEFKFALSSLSQRERHEWNEMGGQLHHFQEWDGAMIRLELACQWLKSAGFPPEVVKLFTSLKEGEAASAITKRLNARKSATNTMEVSAADSMQELLRQWEAADRAAAPTVEAARNALARYTPSIDDLAKQASQSAKEIEQETELQISDTQIDQEASESKPNERMASANRLDEEQANLGSHHEQLKDALIELASKQDLLSENEREIARDSDLALKLLDASKLPLFEAIEAAKDANLEKTHPKSAEETKESWQSVQAKAKALKQTYDKIGKHFAQLGSGGPKERDAEAFDLNASREWLQRQAESAANEYAKMPSHAPLNDTTESYEHAKSLADWNTADPMELLRRLENELRISPEMQLELSDIASKNVRSVVSELRSVADGERAIDSAIENADPTVVGEKRRIVDRLRWLADKSDRSTQQTLARAFNLLLRRSQTEEAGVADGLSKQLRAMTMEMKQINESSLLRDIQHWVDRSIKQLDETEKLLERSRTALESLSDPKLVRNEQARQGARNEMQQLQRQWREEQIRQLASIAQDSAKRSEQASERNADLQSNAQKQLKAIQDAHEAFQRSPKSESDQAKWRSELDHWTQDWAKLHASDRALQNAIDIANQSNSEKNRMEQSDLINVDRPNPYATLAKDWMGHVLSQVASLQSELKMMQKQSSASATAVQQSLLAQPQRHQNLRQSMGEAVETLRSTARHEARLGRERVSDLLNQSANRVQETDNTALARVENELKRAEKQVGEFYTPLPTNADKSDTWRSLLDERVSELPSVGSLQSSLSQAEEQVRSLAVQVEESFGMPSESSPPAHSSEGTPKRETRGSDATEATNSPLTAQRKARMLDELDRELLGRSIKKTPVENDASKPSANQNSAATKPASRSSEGKDTEDRSGSGQSVRSSVREAADQLAGAMGQERRMQSNSANDRDANAQSESNSSQSSKSGRGIGPAGPIQDFVLPSRQRENAKDWAKLRSQRAEDVIEGKRETFDPEFSDAIKAYYQAIGTK
jgi:hypothetical protein